MTPINTTTKNQDFHIIAQNSLKKINSFVDEQRKAKTIALYDKYQRSIEEYLAWFRANNVVGIREEQENDFSGDKIGQKVLELLSDEDLGRPARDAYNMVLSIVVEHGPGNAGLTNLYVREVVEALQKLGYM